MRVVHVTRGFPPRCIGGMSTAVDAIVAIHRDAGWCVGVVSFDGYRARAAGAVAPRVRQDGAGGWIVRVLGAASADEARARIVAFAPDVVYLHHGTLWSEVDDACRRVGARVVAVAHVCQAVQAALRGVRSVPRSVAAQRALLRAADEVIAPSRAAADALAADVPECASRLRVAALPVPDCAAALAAAGPPARGGPILYAGRFSDVNGTAEWIAAIPAVARACPRARFVVAGGVPENPRADARWRARFSASAPQAELVGWLGRDALARHYAGASIVVVPSWFETFGLTAVEAMCRGRAVVATAAGALVDHVEPGVTGVLVPPRDPVVLAEAVAALARDPDRAIALGTAAAAAARRRYCSPTTSWP